MWERTVIVCVPNSLCNGSCYYWSWHDIAPNFHYILKASSGGMLENALCSKLYVFETSAQFQVIFTFQCYCQFLISEACIKGQATFYGMFMGCTP